MNARPKFKKPSAAKNKADAFDNVMIYEPKNKQ